MEWLKRLSQAIDYIEDNLTGEISYEKAAEIACCSTYYFQRIFSYVVGVPLSDYIRRRKMTKAAFEIQVSDEKIVNIGSKYGYPSAAAFNRAFHSVHGVAPTKARTEGTKLNAYGRISLSVAVTGSESMRYRIESKESIRIVGTKVPLVEEPEHNFKTVPMFWDSTIKSEMFPQICELSNQEPFGILGVTVYRLVRKLSPGDFFV